MYLDWTYVWICVLAFLTVSMLAFGLVVFALKKDTEKEARRRGASKLAGELRALGLKWIPDMLESYSVGDYSGMIKQLANTIRVFLHHPDMVTKEFEQVFDRVLSVKLKSPEARAYISAKLDEARGLAQKTDVSMATAA